MAWLAPILLHYYITEQCNSRCGFCDIWRHPSGIFAELTDVKNNLRDAARLGVRFVDFTGGEPLLHPELPKMLEIARSVGLRTTLTTNALLYPERGVILAGSIDFLHFSLDAAMASDHDRLRGIPSFNKVMASIDLARTLGEKPDIIFTAQHNNLHHLPALVEFCRRTGLILVVNPVFSLRKRRELTPSDLKLIEQFAHSPFVYINRAFHLLRTKGGNDPEKPRCRVVDAAIVISPQNELILPCYHHAKSRVVLTDGLDAHWQDPRVGEYRANQGRWPSCKGCTLNCYFDPSFCYHIDRYFTKSLSAKIKYSLDKYVRHPLLRWCSALDTRPAAIILAELFGSRTGVLENP